MAKNVARPWRVKARFRRRAFGWKSQPPVPRVKEAVGEISAVACRDPALAAERAVVFLERVSPALKHVDGSSGAIGTPHNDAIDALVSIIAGAPVDAARRERWKTLDRAAATRERIRALVPGEPLMTRVLGAELGLSRLYAGAPTRYVRLAPTKAKPAAALPLARPP